jgi:enolase
VDVAAEHLHRQDGHYRFGESTISGAELLKRHLDLVKTYNMGFLEDPFDAADQHLWRELTKELQQTTCVVGDDLFATDSAKIEPGLATGIILKPNQTGTVTGVLSAARAAHEAGMLLCVSHRSGETEDTMMCDLAVAIGASFIKVGGPRRGDRTAKYNQLIRLATQMNSQINCEALNS